MKSGLEEIFEIFKDAKTLRNIALIDCNKFEEICKSDCAEYPDLTDYLIALNAILKSDDIESLKTCELYRDILNGVIYTKPTTTVEALDIVHTMRTIALIDYEKIVTTLEVKHLGDNMKKQDEQISKVVNVK